jgi:hypothetical protein
MNHSILGIRDFQFRQALRRHLPPRLLRQAIARTARRPTRDRQLPNWIVLACLIAWFAHATAKLPFVARWLCRRPTDVPSDAALYQTRHRLGWAPLRWLRRRLVRPLARPGDGGTDYHGHRLLALDGTTLTVADTPANARTFGRAGNQHGRSGYPLLRLVALCEVGTHALLAWIARAYRVSEQALAARLYRLIPRGSLLLVDRNFHAYALWQAARQGRWQVFLRVQAGPRFPVVSVYPDGSYRSRVYPRRGRRKKARAIPVRVIVYTWADAAGQVHASRLLTSLLDAGRYPATALLGVYHQRWEQEGVFREIKGVLAERPMQLRAQSPLGVLQELDGLLLGHYVVRGVIAEAARRAGVAAGAISFRGALRLLQMHLSQASGRGRSGARSEAVAEARLYAAIGRERVGKRRPRRCPRKKKVTRGSWPVKRPGETDQPVPTFHILAPPNP